MGTLYWNDWAFIVIVAIIFLVSLAEVIEGWNDEDRNMGCLRFKSQIEQRFCRFLLTVVCPTIYIVVAFDYIIRHNFASENIGSTIILGIILLIARFVIESLLYIILYTVLVLLYWGRTLFRKETWVRFKNWLLNN